MKSTYTIIITAILIAGGLIALSIASPRTSSDQSSGTADNVTVVDGTQIITIAAKGGYTPRISNAKAHVPTIIRMKTSNTFDCSSSVIITTIGFRAILKSSGTTDIPVPAQEAGTVMQGLCGMGMYNFTVNFN